jgi:hypothetical protein
VAASGVARASRPAPIPWATGARGGEALAGPAAPGAALARIARAAAPSVRPADLENPPATIDRSPFD